MIKPLNWKIGFEIELLAPRGASRQDLADAIARKFGGYSKRCFYLQSEPSAVPGKPVFENLVLGFDVYTAAHQFVVKCVDDLTIRHDLDRGAEGREGWYRILSDDVRFLRLIMARCDPAADKHSVLAPIAELFKTRLRVENGIVRVADIMSSPIALVAPLPGERERPCELITPPIEAQHFSRLKELLDTATELGFSVPHEAAIHMHFDAERLCNTEVFCRLIQVLQKYHTQIRNAVGTNINCVRLGKLPNWLFKVTKKKEFKNLNWADAREYLADRGLSKYCDFNIMNFVYQVPGKSTFEVRLFPGSLDAREVVENAHQFETILNWCVNASKGNRLPANLTVFLNSEDKLINSSHGNAVRWFNKRF
ncbi:amidoligase family protein [Thiorhodovibrio winogradskyi]|uniref:amidoligase family protein n=1 Tax=Thiorhodovibrio winogradskyi TaxID=77007 RepID=UPI002E28CB2C|nr:amidoligase family protein [Thiorhodovibrio winogradskyi]